MSPSGSGAESASLTLVRSLDATFREQVRRAVGMELDGSVESLAVVDHYLRMGRDEDRAAIVVLLASGAGAYFGELVRQTMGATWIGDGQDPRRLRLLLEPQFVYFAPVDVAFEAVLGGSVAPETEQAADLGDIDAALHLRTGPDPKDNESAWIAERLGELAPVPADQFHTLTCRFETLQTILEFLAAKQAQDGGTPRTLGMADYLGALSGNV